MMKDIYLFNKNTGEIEPSMKAIGDFYKTHKWNEDWHDEWEETDMIVDGTEIAFPDFASTI